LEIKIKENSWLAKLASKKLGTNNCAIVWKQTVHLYNASKGELLQNEAWLRHELAHVTQWKQHGTWRFLLKYSWYSIRFGYYNNPFEIEARHAEKGESIAKNIHFEGKIIG
jgi:hypothetical protein